MDVIQKLNNTVKSIGIETSDDLYKGQANILRGRTAVAKKWNSSKWHARHGDLNINFYCISI